MGRWKEIRELTRQRTLTFLRQPEAVFWVLGFPLVLAAVLGFAFQSSAPPDSRVAVLEEEEGSDHAALVERLGAARGVELVRYRSRDEAERALRVGRVDVLLLEPDADPPLLRLDPTRAEAESARLRVLVALGALPEDALFIDEVRERGSRYIDFLLPGLLGMNLMGTGIWSIAFAVADMRQRKVLKRLLVTPMRKASLMLSFLLSRLIFLVLEVALLMLFGVYVLDVPFRADVFSFSLLCLLGAVAFSGLGLLTASRTKTIEGASGMINLVLMPMWLGSGVFFSYERFPEAVHPFLRALPLTALNDALRATLLEGASLASLPLELGILLLWAVLPFLIALRIFRWA